MVLRHICNCMRKPACRIRDLTVATCEGATFGGCDGKHSPEVDERASATLEYVEGGGTEVQELWIPRLVGSSWSNQDHANR